ncbi:MAG: HAMP domain-containing histidine kinase [Deltaproteobacteria bacterium]|nr:HAMP domain-containing histidine kinase [Deltaproteobacteria bacterium]
MKIRHRITNKLFAWYFLLVLIFYGTILVFYVNVQKIMSISEDIVNKNYKISSSSKKMIEDLLNMEENEQKYRILKKKNYLDYFINAQKDFETNLNEILQLKSNETLISKDWIELDNSYRKFLNSLKDTKEADSSELLWVPEEMINEWIQRISKARLQNEHDVELATRELNHQGQMTVKSGLIGLGVSIIMGLLGSIFLTRSMILPIRELQKGIKSIAKESLSEQIRIRSKDEFGELAAAFNEMTFRLKEEERMRSDFISMLSHETRTPLTSIRESVNMIVEEVMGPINDRQRKFLEISSSEIGRICDLMNHLIQVSRLESGVIKIQPYPLDPSILVSKCRYHLKPLAESNDITVKIEMSKDIPLVMGDPENLQQVILNLMGNAIKFSPRGGRVLVRVEPDENIQMLRVSISDNGPGIPEEEQSFIFNKYYRAKNVRKHSDGVGLGLSISKHIIEAHNGTIWVKSALGHGSTFEVRLPIA